MPTARKPGSRTRRIAPAVWLCLLGVAGCSYPNGLPQASPPPTVAVDRVSMITATDRAASPEPGVLYSDGRGATTVWNDVVVSIPPADVRSAGVIRWPLESPADPTRSFATLSVETRSAHGPLFTGRRGSKRVLVYVHGFRTRFQSAVHRFAQVVHDSGTTYEPVLFSWPSRGTVMGYYYDRESMDASRDAFEAVLRRLAADASVREIGILAHSGGAWLTTDTLRTMAVERGGIPDKITRVVLAAPDLDVDVFGRELDRIGERPAFTVLLSRDDGSLRFSSLVADGAPRLGACDPTAEPQRTIFARHHVAVVDATALRGDDPTGHHKFSETPELLRFIGETFSDPDAGATGRGIAAVRRPPLL